MPYIAHLLQQCVCGKGDLTCVFQKNQMAKFKVPLRHKQHSAYQLSMRNGKRSLPSLMPQHQPHHSLNNQPIVK